MDKLRIRHTHAHIPTSNNEDWDTFLLDLVRIYHKSGDSVPGEIIEIRCLPEWVYELQCRCMIFILYVSESIYDFCEVRERGWRGSFYFRKFCIHGRIKYGDSSKLRNLLADLFFLGGVSRAFLGRS